MNEPRKAVAYKGIIPFGNKVILRFTLEGSPMKFSTVEVGNNRESTGVFKPEDKKLEVVAYGENTTQVQIGDIVDLPEGGRLQTQDVIIEDEKDKRFSQLKEKYSGKLIDLSKRDKNFKDKSVNYVVVYEHDILWMKRDEGQSTR